ncbi:MAG: type II secretion system F family protein [Nanoarchaeota archaeon]|nr:type II secretion system F family protein [Nanoarchaeota archaeon]
MEAKYIALICFVVGINVIVFSAILFNLSFESIIYMITGLLIAVSVPFFMHEYFLFSAARKMEARFPDFLRDVSEAIRAGMTIPQAIVNASKTNYGPLTDSVKKLSYMISWGIPFPEALRSFMSKLRYTPYIKRGLSIVLQSYYSGGDIATTMKSIADATSELQEVEKDRESSLKQQVFIVYVIHFVFLGIMVAMYNVLIPMISARPTEEGLISFGTPPSYEYFKTLFFLTLTIQSFSNALVAGQTMEGNLLAGFKHMAVMLPVSLLAYVIFIFPVKFEISISLPKEQYGPGEEISLFGVVKFEGTPAANADVEINLGGKTLSLKTQDNGEFSAELTAPGEKGIYDMTIHCTYNGYEKTVVKQVMVS